MDRESNPVLRHYEIQVRALFELIDRPYWFMQIREMYPSFKFCLLFSQYISLQRRLDVVARAFHLFKQADIEERIM